jgi:hypothetical protein
MWPVRVGSSFGQFVRPVRPQQNREAYWLFFPIPNAMANSPSEPPKPSEPAPLPQSGTSVDPRAARYLDGLAYSSILAAGVAGALTAAASWAFGLPIDVAVVGLASSGTLVVYNIDRLRDLQRDRVLAPLRSNFIERNFKPLGVITILAAVSSAIFALQLSRSAWGLCAGILAMGLLHRRLKRIRGIKTVYLTSSWLAVVLGLPLLESQLDPSPGADQIYWVSTILGCAILSNLMASNLDRRVDAHRAHLGAAIVIAGLGIGFALLSPPTLRGLAMIPAAEFVALARFREGERYRAVVVDGALLIGACAAIVYMAIRSS